MGKENLKEIQRMVKVLDEQLSEDKKLFRHLIDKGLVNDEGKVMINNLIKMQMGDFKIKHG